MSGYSYEGRAFTTVDALMNDVVERMLENGFDLVYPSARTETSRDIVLQPTVAIDPLVDDQAWQVRFMWDRDPSTAGDSSSAGATVLETVNGGKVDIVVATPMQFADNKCANYKIRGEDGMETNAVEYIGLLGTMQKRGAASEVHRQFIDRSMYAKQAWPSYPMNYRLSISDRGFALYVWEQATDSIGNRHSFVVVQRPVDNISGEVVVTGKCPVHCLYGMMAFKSNRAEENAGAYNIRRFVVRESDVNVPYPRQLSVDGPNTVSSGTAMMGVDATRNNRDYAAIINASQQVSITENNKYIVTFPNGLNTARYGYTHEMDMVAYTSADVVSLSTEIPLTVYGESEARLYAALGANGQNNTGMRLLMLVDGAGVTPDPTQTSL